jgi:predicted O-linked N-acetylglucosamine transferase (SPINDLY family)
MDASTLNLAGLIAKRTGALSQALTYFDQALMLSPDDHAVLFNAAVLKASLGDHDKAIQWLTRAVSLNQRDADSHYHLAVSLEAMGQIKQAVKHFEQAVELNATQSYLLGHVAHLKSRLYDWQDRQAWLNRIQTRIDEGEPCALPFHVVTMFDDVALQRRSVDIFLRHQDLLTTRERWQHPRGNRIRVAYLSCDFYDHATSHLMWELLKWHDRTQFEVWVYGWDVDQRDVMHEIIRRHADHYVDISDLSAQASVELIRSARIDIAIDLKGFTHGARPDIFALRCAPIQVAYLGYPGTTGISAMDYAVADRQLIDDSQLSQYREKILWMPNCYQVNAQWQSPVVAFDQRATWGLPHSVFVYASFNRGYKLTPACFSAWMHILRATPQSVLWLLEEDDNARDQLIKHAQREGVEADRFYFCAPVDHEQHLQRIALADVCLDTFPCGGHTTTSDVLRAGVPLVTLRGHSWMARVSASLLHALGLSDWITHDEDSYKEWAIKAARDPLWLQLQRRRLLQACEQSSVFDPKRWTRDFEALLQAIGQNHDEH